jgi:hypothetical protein
MAPEAKLEPVRPHASVTALFASIKTSEAQARQSPCVSAPKRPMLPRGRRRFGFAHSQSLSQIFALACGHHIPQPLGHVALRALACALRSLGAWRRFEWRRWNPDRCRLESHDSLAHLDGLDPWLFALGPPVLVLGLCPRILCPRGERNANNSSCGGLISPKDAIMACKAARCCCSGWLSAVGTAKLMAEHVGIHFQEATTMPQAATSCVAEPRKAGAVKTKDQS